MSAVDCTCGHPQSKHKSLKLGCRGCDIGCSRYEPEATAEAVEPVPAEELGLVADLAPDLDVDVPTLAEKVGKRTIRLSGQATPAQAEVERERDRLQENEKRWAGEVEHAERERDEERRLHAVTRTDLGVTNAELATARQELDRLRADLTKRQRISAGLVAEVDKQAGAGKLSALLARALETGAPALTAAAENIRRLADELEQALAEHARAEELRAEAARLEDRLAEIRRELNPVSPARQLGAEPEPTDKQVRDWAQANRVACNLKGRVGALVRAQYRHAMAVQESTNTEGAPTA